MLPHVLIESPVESLRLCTPSLTTSRPQPLSYRQRVRRSSSPHRHQIIQTRPAHSCTLQVVSWAMLRRPPPHLVPSTSTTDSILQMHTRFSAWRLLTAISRMTIRIRAHRERRLLLMRLFEVLCAPTVRSKRMSSMLPAPLRDRVFKLYIEVGSHERSLNEESSHPHHIKLVVLTTTGKAGLVASCKARAVSRGAAGGFGPRNLCLSMTIRMTLA